MRNVFLLDLLLVLLRVLLPVVKGGSFLALERLVKAFKQVSQKAFRKFVDLLAKLHSFAGPFLEVVQGRVILNVAQQRFNVLLEHGESALAELEGSVMLFQLGQDRTVLKF